MEFYFLFCLVSITMSFPSWLKKSGYGCYIGTTFLGALAYADEILLLSPLKIDLNKMLATGHKFSKKVQHIISSG